MNDPTPAMPGLDLLDPEAVAARDAVFGACYEHSAIDLDVPSENLRERWTVRWPWKLIVPTELSDLEGPELYNLADDPAESEDLAGEQPDRVEAMRKTLDGWWAPSP